MALKLNSSGGGSVTLDPVSTASNVTITIPATDAGSLVTADSSGNVGIGTSTPGQRLDVVAVEMPSIQIGTNDARKKALLQYNEIANTFTIGVNDGYSLTPIIFRVNGADRMTLDASGNLGIGTNTPSSYGGKLNVYAGDVVVADAGTSSGASAPRIGSSSQALVFKTNTGAGSAAEVARFDGSGNLGLGVTPSAYESSGGVIYASGITNSAASGATIFGYNTNFSGGVKYLSNGYASQYYQLSGQHVWRIAPSGTAGAAITFTQAMTLDESGNLLVGTTAAAGFKLRAVSSGATVMLAESTSTAAYINISDSSSTNSPQIGSAGNNLVFRTGVSTSDERLRIDTAGNVTPGVTNTQTLGAVGDVWSNVHATTFTGAAATLTGNLTFSSASQRILGDFSNATVSARLAFQSSTVNGNTGVFAIPNGTSTGSNFSVSNSAAPDNSSIGQLSATSTDIRLTSGISGTGTYLPLTFYTSGVEKMRIQTNGNLLIAAGAQTTSVTATQSTASITLDCNLSNVFQTTLTASLTSVTYSNPHDGQTINWFITQGGTGSYTVSWSSVTAVKWPGAAVGVLSTAVGSVDLVVLTYRSATGFWYATLSKAFA